VNHKDKQQVATDPPFIEKSAASLNRSPKYSSSLVSNFTYYSNYREVALYIIPAAYIAICSVSFNLATGFVIHIST
jgi:hypothetical protein